MQKREYKPEVILISADQEWDSVKEILKPENIQHSPFGEWFPYLMGKETVVFFFGGWGKVSSAASTQYVIDRWQPSGLVNLGTCGGFDGLVAKGEIILVEETLVYDMVEQMTDSSTTTNFYRTRFDFSWLTLPYPHPVKRACLVSGDRDLVPADIPLLKSQYGAVAGDWESASIAWVAQRNHTPCLILRGVSDVVTTDGSETYGNLEAFCQGAKMVMQKLLDCLPQWLEKMQGAV